MSAPAIEPPAATPPAAAPPVEVTAKSDDFWGVLKSVAETASLLGLFSSILGWSYLSAYFNMFGFRPWEIDISSPVVSIFAVALIDRAAYVIFPAAALFILCRAWRPNFVLFRGTGLMISLLVLTVCVYQLGTWMGRLTARNDMYEKSKRLPSVGFYVSDPLLGYPPCVNPATPRIACRLLFHSKGVYVFFPPISSEAEVKSEEPGNIPIYALPEGKVRFIEFQRGVN
jgi:hypothetical protein